MLRVHHLSKSFDALQAVNDISFTLDTGSILVVLGPSGCGKSTLLALIAGLITPDSGDVLWDNESITGMPTHQRSFGLMFQDYALFPHLNVGDNVGFGVATVGAMHASPLLERVGLKGFEKRDVQTLSGGEAQRVALARALAPRPRLLMLDEPLGALDRALREQLTRELREILNEFNQTAIYVTHDQQEAFGVADHIAIMQSGSFVQIGTPEEVYRNPQNNFVREFLGNAKLIEGQVNGDKIESEIGEFEVGNLKLEVGDEVTMLIRPEGIRKK
ncbi:MAG: ABC transporter ATP-binding protein [Chloroflexi bacterium]|nr:ABC transporter ATP-binding protein [Chloroflexota bacterium]